MSAEAVSWRIVNRFGLAPVAITILSSCALPSTVDVSSDPPGARVLTLEVHALNPSEPLMVGVTPCTIQLSRGALTHGHVVLCEKEGYLAGGFSVFNTGEIFAKPHDTMHVQLLRDHTLKLKAEGFNHLKDVGDRVLEITALYEEMLATPQFMAGIPAAKARSKFESLLRDFPDLKDSALEGTFTVLAVKVDSLLSLNTGLPTEKPLQDLLVRQVSYLMGAIKTAVSSRSQAQP